MGPEPAGPGGFHGRRKGKRLRAGQEERLRDLLPGLAVALPLPADLGTLFAHSPTAIWLEIGFGGGEHLAAAARTHPGVGLIGVEPFVNGMAKMLAAIAEDGLRSVRLFDRDATELLEALPPASLDRAYLLFPDPWPKRRQRKRRFVSDATLARLARALKPDAEFRFATDIDDYAGWTLARVLRSPDFAWDAQGSEAWRRPWAGWPGTRYEAKALREGRPPSYLTFRRV
ncbi:MAG: tRNA (guanosine(46)-N7)-methyltransferase TrmB [Methylobacteriaceae bacterium]|nr:tRNA (guanosine(46)-N7)-methyltransferase TrmB [Methylobacteriaceae bacterium]